MTTNDVSDTRISRERLAPWPLGGYAPGRYSCTCADCGKTFEGDKRAMQCLECAVSEIKTQWQNHASRHPQPVNEPGEWQLAIKPFADKASLVDDDDPDDYTPDWSPFIPVGAYRAAAACLRAASIPKVEPVAPAPVTITDAARDVLAERKRQVEAEGWSPEHDDEHRGGSLAMAAACYAAHDHLPAEMRSFGNRDLGRVPELWPRSWDYTWFKPKDRRRDLVKAGALILAEIERLDRAALSAKPTGEE